MATQFKKLLGSLLNEKRDQRIFERAWEHIAQQVENPSGELSRTRFNRIPGEAKAIYWLWRFSCDAGICGIDVFILDSKGVYAPETHAALLMIGADELAHCLEAAVYFARTSCAEFKRLKDQSWFKQFRRPKEFRTLESINKNAFTLADSLTVQVVRFMKLHSDVLFN